MSADDWKFMPFNHPKVQQIVIIQFLEFSDCFKMEKLEIQSHNFNEKTIMKINILIHFRLESEVIKLTQHNQVLHSSITAQNSLVVFIWWKFSSFILYVYINFKLCGQHRVMRLTKEWNDIESQENSEMMKKKNMSCFVKSTKTVEI